MITKNVTPLFLASSIISRNFNKCHHPGLGYWARTHFWDAQWISWFNCWFCGAVGSWMRYLLWGQCDIPEIEIPVDGKLEKCGGKKGLKLAACTQTELELFCEILTCLLMCPSQVYYSPLCPLQHLCWQHNFLILHIPCAVPWCDGIAPELNAGGF